MSIWLKNATVFDGKAFMEGTRHLVVEGGRIAHLGAEAPEGFEGQTLDLEGRWLCPGFWDLHTHLREPGQEWREDLTSGSLAGAAGGYTTLVAMPNTDPPVDCPSAVSYVARKGRELPGARVLPAGCVSKERKGEELAELLKMAEEGAVLFTDDGAPVRSSGLLRLALRYLDGTGLAVMEHSEDRSLFGKGQVHEGVISAVSGLAGVPSSCEVLGVQRGIELLREVGGRLHFTHLSAARSLELIRDAKAEGLSVTCDVTPHHLTFSEEDVMASGYDGYFKVNPPLRSVRDREALWGGIEDGTVDAIGTDHAPWHADEKDLPFQEASFGIASLECAAAGVLDGAARRGVAAEKVLAALTRAPRCILGRGGDDLLAVGAEADLTVVDPDRVEKVNPRLWRSKTKHSPWSGVVLKGWPVLTLLGDRVLWRASEEQ